MDFKARKTIITADGSTTLALEGQQETYHSKHGALQESRYVFIEKGLDEVAEATDGPIRIFELGFGTGLNALLAWEWAELRQREVVFESIEYYPLVQEEWEAMSFDVTVPFHEEAFALLHTAEWEEAVELSSRFSLIKKSGAWLEFQVGEKCDVLFFDAFGPPTQPELWTSLSLSKSVELLKKNGLWVSYCSKGQVRRDLEASGLTMERLPGPPGKREMMRGRLEVDSAPASRFNVRCYMLLLSEDQSAILVSDEMLGDIQMTKFPGGGLEFGEGPVGCIHREAIEELGQPVKVLEHFYTTEWFQRSRFRASDQLLSLYYLVNTVGPTQFPMAEKAMDFQAGSRESFRWLTWEALKVAELSFPVDRWVVELLLRRFSPALSDPSCRQEYR